MKHSSCAWMRWLSSQSVPAESTSWEAQPAIAAQQLVQAKGAPLRMGTAECIPTAAASSASTAGMQAQNLLLPA